MTKVLPECKECKIFAPQCECFLKGEYFGRRRSTALTPISKNKGGGFSSQDFMGKSTLSPDDEGRFETDRSRRRRSLDVNSGG